MLPLNIVANSVSTIDQPLCTGGDSTFVMTIALLTVWVFRLPVTWLLCFKLNMGALGVFLGNTIALSFRTVSGMIRFSTEKWTYKKVSPTSLYRVTLINYCCYQVDAKKKRSKHFSNFSTCSSHVKNLSTDSKKTYKILPSVVFSSANDRVISKNPHVSSLFQTIL